MAETLRQAQDTVLYRKWRPRTFAELAGQEHVARTLTNALSTGRVAHAYLFAGPRGTGKTSAGRLLAKALNCTRRQDGEACNRCDSCLSFLAGRAMDLIELDAASNRGIDEIRSLREKVAFAPGAGEYKVYLIDEVHMLTEAAFNALLKTLEEPPPHVVFVLATTEAHKLPATIASRCQRFDFRRIPLAAAVKRLEGICAGESLSCEPEALALIARSATGSLRDAVNLLDQLATSYGSDLAVEHVRAGLGLIGDERAGQLARLALAGESLAAGLALIASVRDDGLDLRQFQRELVEELRALLVAKSGLDPSVSSGRSPAEGATTERREELRSAVVGVPAARVYAALRAFVEADLRSDPSSTLPLDIALAECVLAADGQAGNLAIEQSAPGRGTGGSSPLTGGMGGVPPASPLAEAGQTSPPTRRGTRDAQREREAAGFIPQEPSAPVRGEPVEPRAQVRGPAARPSTSSGRAELPSARPEPLAGRAEQPAEPPANGGAPVELTLEALRRSMRLIYQKARARSPQLGALLNSGCDIMSVDDREVLFEFKYRIHADRAAAKANLDGLRSIILELTGREMIINCLYKEDVSDWKQRETASRSALVRAAQELGARVLPPEFGPPAGKPTAAP